MKDHPLNTVNLSVVVCHQTLPNLFKKYHVQKSIYVYIPVPCSIVTIISPFWLLSLQLSNTCSIDSSSNLS